MSDVSKQFNDGEGVFTSDELWSRVKLLACKKHKVLVEDFDLVFLDIDYFERIRRPIRSECSYIIVNKYTKETFRGTLEFNRCSYIYNPHTDTLSDVPAPS